MSKKTKQVVDLEDVVVKFVGDSGDGMQLIGTLFSETAALDGNDLATFPDFPAEIRAPHNTIAGVSGYQVHIGKKKILTTGDFCDVLVAMNPASLKSNLKWAKPGGTLIIDSDTFEQSAVEKAGYKVNPLTDGSLEKYHLIQAPITAMTRDVGKEVGFDNKTADRSKNMFPLGILFFLFHKPLDNTFKFFDIKFKKKPEVIRLNKAVLQAGYNYADTIEAISSVYSIPKAILDKGTYRNINGNTAVAWGLIAAGERSGRPLFLGSYPITPATEILMELAKHKSLGVKVFQAEDEIAGICSAIGASFTGSLAVTTTSGPGLSLKSEAIGLAVMTELPLVIVDVQRGGPSTGLPTKSEQSDLMQALFGRNGECPVIIVAASSPANAFYMAFEAARLSLEHMTPAILLSEGAIGFGSELFKIPKVKDLPAIHPPMAKPNDPDFKPFARDPETLARKWAIPGTEGLRHRVGGLEKENITGVVSTDPQNHQLMTKLRAEKVQRVERVIPKQDIYGDAEGDLLVIGWGSTKGAIQYAVDELRAQGKKVGHAHFHYIMPLPTNTAEVFAKYKKIVVCELNSGQFIYYLRMLYPEFRYRQYNKVQGLPFVVNELTSTFNQIIEEE